MEYTKLDADKIAKIQELNRTIGKAERERDKLIWEFEKEHGLDFMQFQSVYNNLKWQNL